MLVKSNYNIVVKENDDFIVYNTLTQGMLLMDIEHISYLEEVSKFTEDEKKQLQKFGILVDNEKYEIGKLKFDNRCEKHNQTSMSITVAITNNCNFRCKYCYQAHEIQSLSLKDAENLLSMIKNKIDDGLQRLSIHWFGGEPLLNIQVLKYIDGHIQSYIKDTRCKYYSSITTNGFLLDKDMIKNLENVKIDSFQITLDGVGKLHDYNRTLADGSDTFDTIINNIKLLVNKGKKVNIRYNVNKKNKNIEPFIVFLKEEGLLNKVSLNFNRTQKFDKSEDLDDYYFETLEEYAKALNQIYLVLLKYGIKIPFYHSSGVNCKFDCVNNFLVDNNLEIYRCTSSEKSEEFKLGKIVNGRVDFNLKTLREKIINEPFDKSKCLDCKVLPFCMGGCHLLDKMNIEECIPEKYFIEELVRLYYLEAVNDV